MASEGERDKQGSGFRAENTPAESKTQNAWGKKKEYEEAKTGGGQLEESQEIPGWSWDQR